MNGDEISDGGGGRGWIVMIHGVSDAHRSRGGDRGEIEGWLVGCGGAVRDGGVSDG